MLLRGHTGSFAVDLWQWRLGTSCQTERQILRRALVSNSFNHASPVV